MLIFKDRHEGGSWRIRGISQSDLEKKETGEE